MSRDLIFPESSKHFLPPPPLLPPSLLCSSSLPVHGGVRRASPRNPCRRTTGRHRPGERAGKHALLYLHVGLLCVHQLLDDFSEAIRIRQVAGQGPWRWGLALPRSFHAARLGGVKTPAQRGDLFRTLRGDKRWGNAQDTVRYYPLPTKDANCRHPCPGISWGTYPGQMVSSPQTTLSLKMLGAGPSLPQSVSPPNASLLPSSKHLASNWTYHRIYSPKAPRVSTNDSPWTHT